MPRTLILCPTHDHADTLFASVASVRAQQDTDWELVVICDGAPDRSIEILEATRAADPRVRFVVHPKGERLGEAYRDPIVRGTDAEFICHIGDDDLWCDTHLGVMRRMLDNADYAMQGTLESEAGGTWVWNFAQSGTHGARALAHGDPPAIPTAGLNPFAVRRAAYERLESGWSPAPPGLGSDVHMCVKYVRRDDMRIASSAMTSFVKLPSRLRRQAFNPTERLVDLMPVLARINRADYLAGCRRDAVIGTPVMRALYHADAGACASLEGALARIGIRAVAPHATPSIVTGNDTMDVPLTPSQSLQCRMAWLLLRVGRSRSAPEELAVAAAHGISWLLTPYLETWGQYAPDPALEAAQELRRAHVEIEVMTAFIIRTLILQRDLSAAEAELSAASDIWADTGWLAQMRAWYSDTERRMTRDA